MTQPPGAIAATDRLVIRRFRRCDTEAMTRIFGDPEVMRFGAGVQTIQWTRDWIQRCIADYQRKSGIGVWTVVETESEAAIGYCGLFHFPDVCGYPETELGYRLARPYWGRGYATEAARAVLNYGFNTLRLPRLVSIIDPFNVSSIRVAEKLGMRYEKDVMFQGYTHPDRVYAIECVRE